jgi:endonuclease/exonuclease/phosphatase family metal-dependent hydrolase
MIAEKFSSFDFLIKKVVNEEQQYPLSDNFRKIFPENPGKTLEMSDLVEFVSLATYNIRNTTDRYNERKDMLREILHEIQSSSAEKASCLVCGLQEVRFLSNEGYRNQIEELLLPFERIPSNQVYPTSLSQPYLAENDSSFRIDGNCIFVSNSSNPNQGSPNLPSFTVKIISHEELTLSPVRNAQRLVLQLPDSHAILSFTNVHLHHLLAPADALIRLDQIQQTLEWMKEHDSRQSVTISVLVGDFNCSPDEVGYSEILSSGYLSAFPLTHNGCEPSLTFPTGLQASTMDTDGPITCDYIFFKTSPNSATAAAAVVCEIESCELFGHFSHPEDSTLYPSDHIGLKAKLKIEVRREEEV